LIHNITENIPKPRLRGGLRVVPCNHMSSVQKLLTNKK